MSWSTRLLPFLEQQNLWNQTELAFAQNRWFQANPPHVGFGMVMPIFACPADIRTRAVADFGLSQVGLTSYLGVEGTNQFRKDGLMYLDSSIRMADITDGTSNTLLVGERPPNASLTLGWWYAGEGQDEDGSADTVLGAREHNIGTRYAVGCPTGPYEYGPGQVSNHCDAFHFGSLHDGGAHFLFADGSVHFIGYSAAPILPELATRSGGESVAW